MAEKRKMANEKRKAKEAERKADINAQAALLMRKRGPGRPPKAETLARMQAQLLMQQHDPGSASDGRRGRGRPRKDGSAPVPRKLTKAEISAANLYANATDLNVERSRSGRKIQRTTFHDEMEGGGLMKRPRTDEYGNETGMYVAERSAAAAARSAIAGGGKKDARRRPGARECMQITRKFTADVIDQKYFDTLMVRIACALLCS